MFKFFAYAQKCYCILFRLQRYTLFINYTNNYPYLLAINYKKTFFDLKNTGKSKIMHYELCIVNYNNYLCNGHTNQAIYEA